MQAIRASEVIRDVLGEHFCQGQEQGQGLKDNYGRRNARESHAVVTILHLRYPTGFVSTIYKYVSMFALRTGQTVTIGEIPTFKTFWHDRGQSLNHCCVKFK